jgi:predicted Fe-S protein YdhL (DUF1289 family)
MSHEMALRAGCSTQSGNAGICIGCFRTIDEIMMWGTATDAQKREVWLQLRARAEQAGQAFPMNME